MSTAVRRTGAAAALALALVLGAGACSSDDGAGEPAAEASSGSPSAPAERTVPVRVSFGEVTGRVDRQARQRLSTRVGRVVSGWTEAAYLGGRYPRQRFTDAWPGFTPGAAQQARRDRALMSNQDIGRRIDGVKPRSTAVVLDVLAAQGRPVGVTARVRLAFRTTGDLQRTVRVTGRLFLTRTDGQWKVFGYDVAKGAV